MTPAQRDAETRRNIGEAIRQTLCVAPISEHHIVNSFAKVPGVTAEMVESVIASFVNAGWVHRQGKKLSWRRGF